MTLSNEALRLLHEMTEAVRPIVEMVEAGPKTSRDNYAEYIAVIDRLAAQLSKGTDGPSTKMYGTIAVALIKAGAPTRGILDALKVMGHLDSEVL